MNNVAILDPVSELVVRRGIAIDKRPSISGEVNTVVASAVYVERADEVAIAVEGAELYLRHAVVAGVDREGVGILVDAGSIASISHTVVSGARSVGVGVYDASATLRQLVVDDTEGAAERTSAGLSIEQSSGVDASGIRVRRAAGVGVFLDEATAARLDDVRIETVTFGDGTAFGRGLVVQGGDAQIERVAVTGAEELGSFIARGASVKLSDVTVANVDGHALTGRTGHGVHVQGANVVLERAELTRTRGFGLVTVGAGEMQLVDVRVADTMPWRCSDSTCADTPFGTGIGSFGASTAAARHFEVEDAALCGVHLAEDGQLDLALGIVDGASIGACVGDPSYDLARLQNDVRYFVESSSIETLTLPVPPLEDVL
jgi:hypothetical protein